MTILSEKQVQSNMLKDDLRWKARLFKMRNAIAAPLRNRIREIETLAQFNDYFNPCIPNNFVFMLVNKSYDLQDYLGYIATLTSPMNESNREIKDFAERLAHSASGNTRKELAPYLEEWEKVIECRNNFLGFEKAKRVSEALSEYGIDLGAELQAERSGIIDRFTRIPDGVRGVLRINICLPYSEILDCLSSFLKTIHPGSEEFQLISRIEVAKPPFSDNVKVVYPTLIVYLKEAADLPENHSLLTTLITGLGNVLRDQTWENKIDSTYSDLWMPFVTITQGFKLFKRYLHLLDALDSVYDVKRNYAYLKSDSPEKSNFPFIMDELKDFADNQTTGRA